MVRERVHKICLVESVRLPTLTDAGGLCELRMNAHSRSSQWLSVYEIVVSLCEMVHYEMLDVNEDVF